MNPFSARSIHRTGRRTFSNPDARGQPRLLLTCEMELIVRTELGYGRRTAAMSSADAAADGRPQLRAYRSDSAPRVAPFAT